MILYYLVSMTKHPAADHHLQLRCRTYLFRFTWPKDVRHAAPNGQREFLRSLETDDLLKARLKRDLLLANCKLIVKEIREQNVREQTSPHTGLTLAEEYKKYDGEYDGEGKDADSFVDNEFMREAVEEEAFTRAVDRHYPGGFEAAEKKAEVHGWDKTLRDRDVEQKVDQLAAEITSGDISIPLDAYLSEWLAERKHKVKPQAVDDGNLAVTKFSQSFPTVGSVKTRDVKNWFKNLEKKFSTARVRTYKNNIRQYWTYLQDKEVVDPDGIDPFKNITIETRGTKSYKHFEVDDCVMLLDAAERKPDSQLADLILLVLYTGMRIEEACSLKTKDVKPDRLIITEGKTLAAEREIPIHSEFKPLLQAMITASKDGYVIAGITSKERHGKRHCAVGQRFGRMKDRLEFKKKYQCFHSFRKTVTTLLQQAGVDISVAADILGHQNPHFTWRVYSSGSSMKQKQDAIEKLEYPPLPELTKERLLGS